MEIKKAQGAASVLSDVIILAERFFKKGEKRLYDLALSKIYQRNFSMQIRHREV